MASQEWDESEYPYAARYGNTPAQFPTEVTLRLEHARFIWRWLSRVGIAAAALVVVVTAIVGVVAYQTARRAWLVAELKERGCRVTFAHERGNDPVPSLVREQLGDSFWSEITDINIEGISWSETTADDVQAICRIAARLPSLRTFEAEGHTVAFNQLAGWRSLDRLERIDLKCESLSSADAAVLSQMTSLKFLRMIDAKITGDGLACLAQLPALEELMLEAVEFSVPHTAKSSAFPKLTGIMIHRSPTCDDETLIALGPLRKLEGVNFYKVAVSDRGFAHVFGGGNMRQLSVNEAKLTDASLETLASHAPLDHVAVYGMPLTDNGVKALTGKAFTDLVLDRTKLTDEAFRTFASIQGLQHVSLADTAVTGAGVKYLNPQQPLQHLDLSGTPLTADGIKLLATAKISQLTLSRTSLTDADLLLFVNNDDLEALDVTETKVSPQGLIAFYTARKRRLAASGREEHLQMQTEYLEVVESFLITEVPAESIETQPEFVSP